MNYETTPERQRGWRLFLKEFCSRTDFERNPQYVHTPIPSLSLGMVERLDQYASLPTAGSILTLNLEFVEVLCYDMGIEKSKIWFVTECLEKAAVALRHPRYKGINVVIDNYLSWRPNMKFNVIAGNPPYQASSGKGGAHTLWDKFVTKSLELLKADGHLCYVHPSGWRNVEGTFKDIQLLFRSLQVQYLELHDTKDGQKIFGVTTPYDWYVIKNCPTTSPTQLKCQDGVSKVVDISKLEFVPNGMFDEIQSLIAKEGEETVELLYDCGYHTQRDYMSKTRTKEFKYPCVKYLSRTKNEIDLYWSSTNEKGHFGVPKVMFGSAADVGKITIDYDGEYGMCEFTAAIVGHSKEELENIYKALTSDKFKQVMLNCQFNRQMYNKKVIALFRKDFWKAFVNE